MKILELEANAWDRSLAALKRVNELANDFACAEFSKLRTPCVTGSKGDSMKFSWGIVGNDEEGFVETCEVEKVSIYILPTQSIDNYINDYEGAVLPKTDAHYEAVYISNVESNGEWEWYQVEEKIFLENNLQEISNNTRSWLINELLYDYLFTHKQITELINLEAMQVVVHADIHSEATTITVFSIAHKSCSVEAKYQYIS
jgi:hypothetical protein